jgi:hypothetical protein
MKAAHAAYRKAAKKHFMGSFFTMVKGSESNA